MKLNLLMKNKVLKIYLNLLNVLFVFKNALILLYVLHVQDWLAEIV
jgi:hypothetical protein